MDASLSPEVEAFLAEPLNAVLCIPRGPDRAPHATPVWFHYVDSCFRISITRTRVKYRLLQDAAEVTLVVDDAYRYRTVIVEGRPRITDDDASLLALARALRAKYHADAAPPSDSDLLRALREEERVVVTIVPERVLSWPV